MYFSDKKKYGKLSQFSWTLVPPPFLPRETVKLFQMSGHNPQFPPAPNASFPNLNQRSSFIPLNQRYSQQFNNQGYSQRTTPTVPIDFISVNNNYTNNQSVKFSGINSGDYRKNKKNNYMMKFTSKTDNQFYISKNISNLFIILI